MKPDFHSEREFNTPAEMLTRATFLLVLAALTGGVLLTIAGLVSAEIRLLLAGGLVLGAGWAGRAWLQRRGEFDAAEHEILRVTASVPTPEDTRARELLRLLEQWEAMEQKRGSSEFDPWALQALRNDIRAVIDSDPALSRLFTELRRAA